MFILTLTFLWKTFCPWFLNRTFSIKKSLTSFIKGFLLLQLLMIIMFYGSETNNVYSLFIISFSKNRTFIFRNNINVSLVLYSYNRDRDIDGG